MSRNDIPTYVVRRSTIMGKPLEVLSVPPMMNLGVNPGASRGALSHYLPTPQWRGLSREQTAPPGSLLLIPRRTLAGFFLPKAGAVRGIDQYEFKSSNPVRVLR